MGTGWENALPFAPKAGMDKINLYNGTSVPVPVPVPEVSIAEIRKKGLITALRERVRTR